MSLIKSLAFLVWRVVSKIIALIAFLPNQIARLAGRDQLHGYQQLSARKTRSPEESAVHFISEFESAYGEEHIPFSAKSFTELARVSKADYKYLVVAVQSEEHDDTERYSREVLTNPELKTLLEDDEKFLVWGGSVLSVDGCQVASQIRAARLPCLAVLAPLQSTIALVMRLEGPISPSSAVTAVQQVLRKYESTLAVKRQDRASQSAARQLRVEQDRAYEESLARDRQRAQEAQEQARIDREQQAERERQAEISRNKVEQHQRWRAAYKARMPPEPSKDSKPARISIRYPSGSRHVRLFDPAEPTFNLYAYVDCLDAQPDITIDVRDFEPDFDFELVSAMPRQVIECDKHHIISEDRLLYPSGNLMVEQNTSDEETEVEH